MVIVSLIKRNIYMFVRNKAEVFFSFLSVLIILGLYIFFLSDLQVKNIEAYVGTIEGIRPFVNGWVMAGLVAVSLVTIPIGVLGRMVEDAEKGTLSDFLVAPIKRWQMLLSYVASSALITLVFGALILFVAQGYILYSGGALFTLVQYGQTGAVMVLATLVNCVFLTLIASFFKSSNAYGTYATVVGTMIGFVTGAYVPMGIMPSVVQWVSNVLPVSQSASLLRRIFLTDLMQSLFGNASTFALEYRKLYAIDLYLNDTILSDTFMFGYIAMVGVVFVILGVIRFSMMKQR
ncbi:MAG: ABC transporter permease [Erysipelotrichaceae bacterium]